MGVCMGQAFPIIAQQPRTEMQVRRPRWGQGSWVREQVYGTPGPAPSDTVASASWDFSGRREPWGLPTKVPLRFVSKQKMEGNVPK